MWDLETFPNSTALREASLSELEDLARNIRHFLVDSISQTGGHLSSNLGVVELSIALHRVFDFPNDQIVWDIGHQSYTHKILSGRANQFATLRQKDGLSGFPDPHESPYDTIHAGHASTSLSLAAGIAQAKKRTGDPSKTIAVIGDGALTGGLAYEALNTIAAEALPVICIMNDNGLSISPNVGAIAKHLDRLRAGSGYQRMKLCIKSCLGHGRRLELFYHIKEMLRSFVLSSGRGNLFSHLGLSYLGPWDGHDFPLLLSALASGQSVVGPVLIHLVTRKGYGDQKAESDPVHSHGIAYKVPQTSHDAPKPTYSHALGEWLTNRAAVSQDLHVVTPAMILGSGLSTFAREYPAQITDVGIAEAHAADFALGLALAGKRPVLAIYSTFLQRCVDQVLHDMAISAKHVILAIDRGGLVGGDGPTHQGLFDVSILRMIPGWTILCPASGAELRMALDFAWEEMHTPVAVRYPKESVADIPGLESHPFRYGEGLILHTGRDGMLVSVGTLLQTALDTRALLVDQGLDVGVTHLRFAWPLHERFVERLAEASLGKRLIVLEETVPSGGVAEALRGLAPFRGREIERVGPRGDQFPPLGSRQELLHMYGLNADALAADILSRRFRWLDG